jgi:hypothetical protein
MTQLSKLQLDAAGPFTDLIANRLGGEGRAVPTETAIASIARLAGSLLRSFNFDHVQILKAAVTRLRGKVEYTSLPTFLMAKEFTLTELQNIYQSLLACPIEKKAFRTRVLSSDLVEALDRYKEGPNRPAQLFRIKNRRRPTYFSRALVAKAQ